MILIIFFIFFSFVNPQEPKGLDVVLIKQIPPTRFSSQDFEIFKDNLINKLCKEKLSGTYKDSYELEDPNNINYDQSTLNPQLISYFFVECLNTKNLESLPKDVYFDFIRNSKNIKNEINEGDYFKHTQITVIANHQSHTFNRYKKF